MKPKTMILMVVAIGCGLGASYMTSRLLAERGKQAEPEETVKVLVAKQKIASWSLIKEPEQLFEQKDFPTSVAPRKALAEFSQVKGQRLNKTLDPDKPVSEDDLLSPQARGVAELMEPGQRAISVQVNAVSGISGFVLPGSRVDVVATVRSPETATKTILQYMLVLAVDAHTQRNADTPHIASQTVTLAAKPQEASRLILAANLGELRLVLRNPDDTARVRNTTLKPSDLDRPLEMDPGSSEAEERRPGNGLVKVPTDLPPLPKEGSAPPPAAETPAKATPPVRRFVMKIQQGARIDKVPFLLGVKDEDEAGPGGDEAPAPARPEPKPEPRPEPKPTPTPKVEVKPAPTPAAPPPAFGPRSSRTGRIN
jgi:pilus assembly protein CpaB